MHPTLMLLFLDAQRPDREAPAPPASRGGRVSGRWSRGEQTLLASRPAAGECPLFETQDGEDRRMRNHIRSNVIGYVALFHSRSSSSVPRRPTPCSASDIVNGEVKTADLATVAGTGPRCQAHPSWRRRRGTGPPAASPAPTCSTAIRTRLADARRREQRSRTAPSTAPRCSTTAGRIAAPTSRPTPWPRRRSRPTASRRRVQTTRSTPARSSTSAHQPGHRGPVREVSATACSTTAAGASP